MKRKEIEAVLDTYVRPLLASHGGDMAVDRIENGIVYFRMLGKCSGCPGADLTSEELISKELADRVPGIQKAVLVTDVSQDLIDQAREILRRSRPASLPAAKMPKKTGAAALPAEGSSLENP